MYFGNLTLRPFSAKLLHNTEHFSKMNPYVIFKLGTLTEKTLPAKKQHLEPTWDSEITFMLDNQQDQDLEIIVKHDDLIKDDIIGTATVNLGYWLSQGSKSSNEWIPLFYKGKDAGSLLLEMTYYPGVGVDAGEQSVFNQQAALTQQPVLEPLVTSEVVHITEEATIIKENPIVYEKEIIRERPIITEKEIIYCTQPITIEKPELVETLHYEKLQPQLIQDQPILRKELPTTLNERPLLEGTPIVHHETEFQREAPQFVHERPELFQKEIITEKSIIHEKDIINREIPIIHEKPEIVEREFHYTEAPLIETQQPIIHQEQQITATEMPVLERPLVHIDQAELFQEAPTYVQERTDIHETKVITERPIIHEQSILYQQQEIIQERPELRQTRIFHQEAPILQKDDVIHTRTINHDVNMSNMGNSDLLNRGNINVTAMGNNNLSQPLLNANGDLMEP